MSLWWFLGQLEFTAEPQRTREISQRVYAKEVETIGPRDPGALTINTGDVFTNQSKEQMRVTNDGRVGIGTDKPEATLDIAGTVRARGGMQFEDGTVLNTVVAHSVKTPRSPPLCGEL